MTSQRSHKVGELIHHEVSALLHKGLKDPRIGFVTITGVEMTPDLHLARIFFTVIGDETARLDSEKGLKSAIPFLRRELGRRLRMRLVPDLIFQYDPSIAQGDRIESLLREIRRDERDDTGHTEED